MFRSIIISAARKFVRIFLFSFLNINLLKKQIFNKLMFKKMTIIKIIKSTKNAVIFVVGVFTFRSDKKHTFQCFEDFVMESLALEEQL